MTKICPGRGDQPSHTLALEKFGDNKARIDGKSVYCRACAAANQREWKLNNKAKVLASKRATREKEKAAYGL